MDEDEVQLWYEDEKQKYLDKYVIDLEKVKNKKKYEEKFNKDMFALNKKYYKKMDSAIKRREFSTKIKKRITEFKEKHNLNKKKDGNRQ